jgi:hypothetical protein
MAWRGSYSGPGATPCHQPTIAKISRVIKPAPVQETAIAFQSAASEQR